MTWLTNWNYRKAITISNSGSSLIDYQVLITIDTASLITATKMRSDCGDIRFTSSDGSTLLNYWIESNCNTVSTNIWIKIPSISAGTNTIYIYYGNSSATSLSSGTNTFPLFDEFESYAVDTTSPDGWAHNVKSTSSGNTANSQGVKTAFAHSGTKSYNLYAYGYNIGYLYNDLKINVPTTEILEGWIYTDNSTGSGPRDWHTTIGFLVVYKYANGTFHSIYYQMRKLSGPRISYYTDINFYGPDNLWRARDIEIVANTIGLNTWVKLTRNLRTDFEAQSGWGSWSTVTGLEIHLMSFGAGGGNTSNSGWSNAYFDDVIVRKYASPEPIFSAIGTEEILSPANITATNMTITPSETPCREGICTVTIDVTWTNTGGTSGSFTPSIKIDTVPVVVDPPLNPVSVDPLGTASQQFIVSGMTTGTRNICPDPN